MTGRDAEREQLAALLIALWEEDAGESLDGLDGVSEAIDGYLARLLPVVDRIATQRAAAELRAAAKWALLEAASHEGYAAKSMSRNSDLREAEARVFRAASNRLTGRADALDAS